MAMKNWSVPWMSAMLCVGAVLTAAFGSPSTYDDMAAVRPAGGSDAFWTTTGHSSVTVYVADSTSSSLDSRVPQPASAVETLSSFDSRWRVQERSVDGSNLNTGTPGTLFYFR